MRVGFDKLSKFFLIAYLITISIIILGRIVFDHGGVYAPDPGAFFVFTNNIIDVLEGRSAWVDVVKFSQERSLIFEFPVAVIAYLSGLRSPEFYMAVAWFLYVIPLPFFYLALVRAFRPLVNVDYFVAALPLTITPLLNLGVLYFTDVPSVSFMIGSLALTAQGLSRGSKAWLCAGFVAGILAVFIRYANFMPLLMAETLLAWLFWPYVRQNIVNIAIAAVIAALLGGVIALIFRMDLPLTKFLELAKALDDTVWKYGNGGIEFGIENIFLYRFERYLQIALVWTSAFFAILVVGAVGKLDAQDVQVRKVRWAWLAALIAIIAYCGYAASFMLLNNRYVLPVIVFLIPLVAAIRFVGKIKVAVIILIVAFCADTALYNWGKFGRMTFINTALAETLWSKAWYAPVGVTSRRDIVDVTPLILGAIIADAGDENSRVELLDPLNAVFNENDLRFYLLYMSRMGAFESRLYTKYKIYAAHTGSMKVKEIYERYLPANAYAYALADYLIVSLNDQHSPEFYKGWVESKLKQDVVSNIRGEGLSGVGVLEIARFLGAKRTKKRSQEVPFSVLRVVNRERWASLVKKYFCEKGVTFEQDSETEEGLNLWCDKSAFSEKELFRWKVSPGMMAEYVAIYKSDGKLPVLMTKMKWKPEDGYSRIYVHFIPTIKTNDECKFFVVDHDVTETWTKDDWTFFPADRLRMLEKCSYMVHVGVRFDKTGKDVFYERNYLRENGAPMG